MKELRINIQEKVETKDTLDVYKKWFNGLHHFYTIKVLPPKK